MKLMNIGFLLEANGRGRAGGCESLSLSCQRGGKAKAKAKVPTFDLVLALPKK